VSSSSRFQTQFYTTARLPKWPYV